MGCTARAARHDAEPHSRLAMWHWSSVQCHAGVGIRPLVWVLDLQVRKLVLGEDSKGALQAPLVREAKLKSLKGCGLQETDPPSPPRLSPSPPPGRPPAACRPQGHRYTVGQGPGRPLVWVVLCPVVAAPLPCVSAAGCLWPWLWLSVCGVRMRERERERVSGSTIG